MKANIYIKYKDGILDPQGTTVSNALESMNIKNIESLTIGKYIEMHFSDISKQEAESIADDSCRKLLANPNIETYKVEIVEE
tara:strand:- start:622 stop:867 length:246 start_codon:yes stop_codon:yes gene_type:complete